MPIDKRRLRRQVEEILDTQSARVHEVIVQLAHKDPRLDRLVRIASEMGRYDSVAPTARALFPLERDTLRPPSRTRSASKALAPAWKMALPGGPTSVAAVRKLALGSLKPMLDSDLARKATILPSRARTTRPGGTARRARASRSDGAVPLWAANAVMMRMDKKDLGELPESGLPIQGIFANRKIQTPPTRRSDPNLLPWEVQDSKACAWGIDKIGALSVWGAYGARGGGSKIAVLDTGVDASHPDLLRSNGKSKVTHFAQFDDDGNIVANAKPHDSDEHGTHCAGTIAGSDASGRWIGVAPDAELAAGLVLDGGEGTEMAVLKGMEWAIDLGVDVISMSLGGFTLNPFMPPTYTQTIVNAFLLGTIVVAAVGNEGSQTTGSPGSDLFALTVGATDHADRAAGFSGGRTLVVQESDYVQQNLLPLVYSKPDVSAPGVDVLSAIPNKKWDVFSGTSMATPHVSGAIALLLSATKIRAKTTKGPGRAQLIQQLMLSSCHELGESGQNHRFGWGRIDVLRAIGFARDAGF